MKTFKAIIILGLSILVNFSIAAPVKGDTLGLPGDNLDLYGVLDLFRQSKNVEEFEKAINLEKNKINNLDLNNDGKVDYIRVIDHSKGDAHALTLRVLVNENENQDMAFIAMEKTGRDQVRVQVIGDKEMYGDNYIIEPSDEMKGGGKGGVDMHFGLWVNVWFWPCVHYVYSPSYVVWVSPWHWHYHPVWWDPWYPMSWHHWHPHVIHYHDYYVPVHSCHVPYAYDVYYGHRVETATVYDHRSGYSYRSDNRSTASSGRSRTGTRTEPAYVQQGNNRSSRQGIDPREEQGGSGRPNVQPRDSQKGSSRPGTPSIEQNRGNSKPGVNPREEQRGNTRPGIDPREEQRGNSRPGETRENDRGSKPQMENREKSQGSTRPEMDRSNERSGGGGQDRPRMQSSPEKPRRSEGKMERSNSRSDSSQGRERSAPSQGRDRGQGRRK